ncbi:MAG: hypothetical protein KAT04_09955 [Methylococcales bacterium]|nr:hypothetical protein [Methylococcales bacterium]
MIGKTIGADIKLDQGKVSDADAKLLNIEDKLDSLIDAQKPKISEGYADHISDKLVASQLCVDLIEI